MTTEYEPMLHYLLEMHKSGKSLVKLELNVPCAIFRDTQVDALKILETMLDDFGKSHGFPQKVIDAEASLTPQA